MSIAHLPHTVYVAWSRRRKSCLYVGCTVSEHARLNEHRAGSPWYPFVDVFDLRDYPTRAAGRAAEARTIRELKPVFNRQHHPAPHIDPMAEMARRGEEPKTPDQRLAEAWAELKAAVAAEAAEKSRAEETALLGMPVEEWFALNYDERAQIACAEAAGRYIGKAFGT